MILWITTSTDYCTVPTWVASYCSVLLFVMGCISVGSGTNCTVGLDENVDCKACDTAAVMALMVAGDRFPIPLGPGVATPLELGAEVPLVPRMDKEGSVLFDGGVLLLRLAALS